MAAWNDDGVKKGGAGGLGWVVLILALVIFWLALAYGDGQAASAPVFYRVSFSEVVVAWSQPPVNVVGAEGEVYFGTLGEYRFMPQVHLMYWGRLGDLHFWRGEWRPVPGVEGYELVGFIQVGWDGYWTEEAKRIEVFSLFFPRMDRVSTPE